jgi:hypothetical protein
MKCVCKCDDKGRVIDLCGAHHDYLRLALDRERAEHAKEVADLKQHVDESRQVLTKCLSILRRTPPNYYDYGPNNDYSMGEQDKISLLEILSKILKDPLDVLRGMF